MPRPNIVFFTGTNHVFLRRDLHAWVDIFSKKYGEYNISRFDRESFMKMNLHSELLTPVFLGEKRLIILEGIPFSTYSKENENSDDMASKTNDLELSLIQALDHIPPTTIVLFVSSEPDKRKILYKKLIAEATVKEYIHLE